MEFKRGRYSWLLRPFLVFFDIFVINIFGAWLGLVGLVQDFNLGSFIIQVFWICLGMIAIVVRVKSRAAWRREVHSAPLSPALGAPQSR